MLGRTKIIHRKPKKTDDTQQEQQAKSAESTMQLASPGLPASLKWNRHHRWAVKLDHQPGNAERDLVLPTEKGKFNRWKSSWRGQGSVGGKRGILQMWQPRKITHLLPACRVRDDRMQGARQQPLWQQSPPAQKLKATPAGTCTEQQQVTLATKPTPCPLKAGISLCITLELGSEVL